jgi:Acyl-CoA dehydrogenases
MDFSLTEDQELLKNSIKEFAERVISKNLEEMINSRRIPDEIFSEFRRMNLFGVSVPQKFGGMGASPVEMGIIGE